MPGSIMPYFNHCSNHHHHHRHRHQRHIKRKPQQTWKPNNKNNKLNDRLYQNINYSLPPINRPNYLNTITQLHPLPPNFSNSRLGITSLCSLLFFLTFFNSVEAKNIFGQNPLDEDKLSWNRLKETGIHIAFSEEEMLITDPQENGSALIITATYDGNGASLDTSTVTLKTSLLFKNTKHIKAENKEQFCEGISKYSRDLGHEIDLLYIRAHGDKTTIIFDLFPISSGRLTPETVLPKDCLIPISKTGTILLASCLAGAEVENGHNMLEWMSHQAPGRTVYASSGLMKDSFVSITKDGPIAIKLRGAFSDMTRMLKTPLIKTIPNYPEIEEINDYPLPTSYKKIQEKSKETYYSVNPAGKGNAFITLDPRTCRPPRYIPDFCYSIPHPSVSWFLETISKVSQNTIATPIKDLDHFYERIIEFSNDVGPISILALNTVNSRLLSFYNNRDFNHNGKAFSRTSILPEAFINAFSTDAIIILGRDCKSADVYNNKSAIYNFAKQLKGISVYCHNIETARLQAFKNGMNGLEPLFLNKDRVVRVIDYKTGRKTSFRSLDNTIAFSVLNIGMMVLLFRNR